MSAQLQEQIKETVIQLKQAQHEKATLYDAYARYNRAVGQAQELEKLLLARLKEVSGISQTPSLELISLMCNMVEIPQEKSEPAEPEDFQFEVGKCYASYSEIPDGFDIEAIDSEAGSLLQVLSPTQRVFTVLGTDEDGESIKTTQTLKSGPATMEWEVIPEWVYDELIKAFV